MIRDLNGCSGFILIRDPKGGADKKIALNDVIVDETKASEILCRAIQTIRNDRFLGQGAPYIKIGRSVRYRVSDLLEYLERHRIDPEIRE
jgi:hypothetical protein